MTECLTAPYGAWPSPVGASDVARANIRLSFPTVIADQVWWQELRPEEGGRTTVVHRAADGYRSELIAAPWNARTRVHEYGGRSYLPVPADPGNADAATGPAGTWDIVFASYTDQRLYLAPGATAQRGKGKPPAPEPGARTPRPLTPEPAEDGALRYADFVLSPGRNEIWCVREQYAEDRVRRGIVAVPLDGSAADDPTAVRELVSGSDFYAFPTPSPDGARLAWICWNHPRMPWDGTELRVAVIENGVPGRGTLIKGGVSESVLAPCWRDEASLYVVSDWSGWWNIYQVGLYGEPPQALYPAEEEFAGPLWQLGGRPFAVLGDGRLAVIHGQGDPRLGVLDPDSGELADLDIPYTAFAAAVSADGPVVVGVAGGPAAPRGVVRVDTVTGRTEALRRELDELPDAAYLPIPDTVEIEGPFGRVVHAIVYPPSNPSAIAPDGALPPYVVWVHGGPTSHVTSVLDLEKAYFTSRGIGIIDVNYGGSTGYGRGYRERLRRQWGIVDVQDVIAAARGLAVRGDADPQRLAIRGSSAGGWTALCAVTTGAVAHGTAFSAATSYFGPANLEKFARDTHDFESRYLDGLAGPLPGFEATYRERSPRGHVTDATSPVLVLQGMDDPVVAADQSEAIVSELTEHGIRHAYLAFEGESHGFRRAETVVAALEAELSFYGQVLGFTPPGIPVLKLEADS
ncbi:MAG TPA: prolyl oligopeptidase family serine peptidase [Streptosporangiaceae bacterium]|nr:prolyl oligopeptidase family serine peptidase [Streptosporangiaceae bacterium]